MTLLLSSPSNPTSHHIPFLLSAFPALACSLSCFCEKNFGRTPGNTTQVSPAPSHTHAFISCRKDTLDLPAYPPLSTSGTHPHSPTLLNPSPSWCAPSCYHHPRPWAAWLMCPWVLASSDCDRRTSQGSGRVYIGDQKGECHVGVCSGTVKYIIPLLYMQQWCLSFILSG